MPNRKMDAIQVEETVVGEQWTLAPGVKLLAERLVEAAHRAGAWFHSQQRFSDFLDLMRARATDKHLRQHLCYLRFVAAIPVKDLRLKLSLTNSRHAEGLNARS